MIWSLCALIACQTIGEAIHVVTGIPIPGTIIGIILLVSALALRGADKPPAELPAASALLPYLSLMFVPPGVVAVLRLAQMPHAWLPIVAGTVVSSVLSLVVVGRLAQALLNGERRRVPLAPRTLPRGQESLR